jgi:hypothetical protein
VQFLQFFAAIMVAPRPVVRKVEVIRAADRAKELSGVGEIGSPMQFPIEVRAVSKVLHLLITEVTCWKDKVDRTPRGVSWKIRVEKTGQQCRLVSRPEELTCNAGAVVAVACLRTGAEIRVLSGFP